MATTSRSDDVLEPVIVAIGGPTRAGKSSLARALNAHFGDASKLLTVEDFIIPDNLKLPRVSLGGKEIVNWEHPDCHDWPRMEAELDGLIATANAAGRPHRRPVIVIEGFVVFQHAPFVHRSHVKFFVSASETTCRERRMKTTRVEENYWEQLVWPCYLQYGQLPPGDCAGSMHAAHCFDSNATSSDAIAAQAIAVVEAIARVAVRPFRDSDFEQVAATFLECEPARALGIALYSDKLYVQDVVIEKLGRGYTAHTLHGGDMRSARNLRAVFCTDGGDERSHLRGQFWVLIDLATGQCVGQVGLELKDASIGVGELRRMAVRASHRNHCGGAMLIETLLAHARTCGFKRVELSTVPENARALAFYRRHGFREVRTLPAIPVHGSEPPLLIDWVEYAIELS